jgi:hypothetical protein
MLPWRLCTLPAAALCEGEAGKYTRTHTHTHGYTDIRLSNGNYLCSPLRGREVFATPNRLQPGIYILSSKATCPFSITLLNLTRFA